MFLTFYTAILGWALIALIAQKVPQALGNKDEVSKIISCNIEFSDIDARMKQAVECAEKHKFKLDLSNLKNGSFESIEAFVKEITAKNFDDGCFTKCLYEKAGLLEKDGKIKMSEFDSFYKTSNITEGLLKEVKVIMEDCVKTTEEKFKSEKEIPCKMYVMADFCLFGKVIEKKKELEALCNKKGK